MPLLPAPILSIAIVHVPMLVLVHVPMLMCVLVLVLVIVQVTVSVLVLVKIPLLPQAIPFATATPATTTAINSYSFSKLENAETKSLSIVVVLVCLL